MKREPVKYIRDKAKSGYKKDSECRICGTTENLEFHHYKSVSILVAAWMRKNKYTPQQAVENRDEFIASHAKELYEDTVTLCSNHHSRLHDIYGETPSLGTAAKQARWVQIQREKHGLV